MTSPEFVSAEVSQLRGKQGEERVSLLLYPVESREDLEQDVKDILEGTGETEPTGRAALRVKAPEYAVDDICSLESLKSIDVEHDADLLSGGQLGNGSPRVLRR